MAQAAQDLQGHRLSGATPAAAAHFCAATEAFNFFLGDPIGELDAALREAPQFAMAHLLKAHLFALTTETAATEAARVSLEAAKACPMDAREAGHVAALEALLAGNWTQAAQLLDVHLMEWPRDIVALQSGHNIDFFRADARDLRDRVARALPEWTPEVPGHSVVLGMYAFGLEEAGVKRGRRGEVLVDDYSQSNIPSVYAVGDVTDRINLTPVAIREGHAFADTVFGGNKRAMDHDLVASAVFTQPEYGCVGLTEEEAREDYKIDIYCTSFRPMQTAFPGKPDRVLFKLVVDQDTQRVLGCHIVADGAGELIQLAAIAVKMGATKQDFDRTVAVHPTISEELVTMRTPMRTA